MGKLLATSLIGFGHQSERCYSELAINASEKCSFCNFTIFGLSSATVYMTLQNKMSGLDPSISYSQGMEVKRGQRKPNDATEKMVGTTSCKFK